MCAQSQTIKLDEWSQDERVLVQFRLLYSGKLLGSSKNDTRAELKHAIRKELSPQLKRLWEVNFHLQKLAKAHPLQNIAQNFERAKQQFIPLVTEEMDLRCKLDILFLRPEDPGNIYKSGDLDNRLKTLLDALRIAKDRDELGGHPVVEDPIYCLLEDDRLISEIHITADNLLLLPQQEVSHPNDVFLTIDVSLQAPAGTTTSFYFG